MKIYLKMKMIEILIVTIIVRAAFHENNKYYPQVFLDECLYKIWKLYVMIEWTFLKELMIIKQVHQKSVVFFTVGIFEVIVLSFNKYL